MRTDREEKYLMMHSNSPLYLGYGNHLLVFRTFYLRRKYKVRTDRTEVGTTDLVFEIYRTDEEKSEAKVILADEEKCLAQLSN